MSKNIKKIAEITEVPISTLYNWKKTKPKLFQYLENCNSKEKSEIEKIFDKLTDIEKEMYLSEMKARILRREIDKKG